MWLRQRRTAHMWSPSKRPARLSARCARRLRVAAVSYPGAATPSVSQFLAAVDNVSNVTAAAGPEQPIAATVQPHFGTAAASQALGAAKQLLEDASRVTLQSANFTLPEAPSNGASLHLPTITNPLSNLPALPNPLPALPALPDALQSALLAGPPADLPPHFGTLYLQSLLSSISATLSTALSAAPPLDATPLRPLASTLTNLQSAAALLSSLPATALDALSAHPTASQLLSSLTALTSALSSATTRTISSLPTPPASLLPALASPQDALAAAAATLASAQQNGVSGVEFGTFCLVVAGALAAVAASTPAAGYQGIATVPDMKLTPEYSQEYLGQYFQRRPVEVMKRSAEVAHVLSRFGLAILTDLWTGNLKANEERRARELREVIEQLGPAYVKVAQAVSTRVDLLPPAYFVQIQLLQDRVPPFPCSVAREVIQEELGLAVETVFSELSERPVAAASLGQVYRGLVREQYGGGEVAVKVQRPGVLEQVALDLYLMRQAAVWICGMPEVQTDWVALIDTWATRFFHEMDYRREANSAVVFGQQMAQLQGILVPQPNMQLTTDRVLVSAWVPGEKLSESKAEDVRQLCNTLLNCYLIQLLDTGFLHADPHPGNLIRTPDGRIAILDYGLMTEITDDQRYALVEYIAHLLTEDWPNVAIDLQRLGFIPPEVPDVQTSGLVVPLGSILRQLSGGGGATKLNIDQVMGELEALGRDYPFQVPAFFALILRAFSVIEGIALAVDPDYAIVQECFPYISRRLLRDDSERAKKALRDVLYGGRQRLDVARLQRLADAFQSFTTEGLVASGRPAPRAQVVDPVVREALQAVFSQRGSYVQELLVEELVAAVDALSREALSALVGRVLGSAPAAAALSTVERLGPLRPLLLPFLTPPEILSRLAPAVAVTEEDEEALTVVRGILQLAQRLPAPDAGSASDFVRAVPEVAALVPELGPGILHTGELFTRQFLRRLALRTAAELGRPDAAAPTSAAASTSTRDIPSSTRASSGSTASTSNSGSTASTTTTTTTTSSSSGRTDGGAGGTGGGYGDSSVFGTRSDYDAAMAALGFMPGPSPTRPVPGALPSALQSSGFASVAGAPRGQAPAGSGPISALLGGPQQQQQQQGLPLGLMAAPMAVAAAPLMVPLAVAALPLAVLGHFAVHGLPGQQQHDGQDDV